MNSNSKLRYLIDLYGIKLWIDNLYHEYKTKVLKVDKANELSEFDKQELIDLFQLWLRSIETWMQDVESAKKAILTKIK